MLTVIIQALFYFLPAYAANAAPVLLERFRIWEFLKVPVDLNLKLGNQSLFGASKTYRGIIGGILAGVAMVFLQSVVHMLWPQREYLYLIPYPPVSILWLGFLMGLGEGLGDLLKSFVKRRLNLKSGAASFPLDQTSFLGALLLSFFFYVPPQGHLLAIILISPLIPVIANLIAYKAGWKKVWW
jgi:CDP-2,3-bis-(O-geranylgeranyl)-sn-glycerol synthase